MDGVDQLNGGALIAVVAALWLLYLLPAWLQRRRHIVTERQAVRVQQALRVISETSDEGKDLVEAELTAHKVAIIAREARRQRRLALKAERDRVKVVTREQLRVERLRSEQEKEVAHMSAEMESARLRAISRTERVRLRNTAEYRAAALRRGRLLATGVGVVGLVAVVSGLLVAPSDLAGWWVFAAGAVLVVVSVSMLNAAARTARAYRSRAVASVVTVARVHGAASGASAASVPTARSAEPVGEGASARDVDGAETSGDQGDVRREWEPHPLPRPLRVTREQILAAARAEAAAVDAATGSSVVVASAATASSNAAAGLDALVTGSATESDPREELRRASDEAVAALREAETKDPSVAPIESAKNAASEGFEWLTGMEADVAAVAAENASRLDEALERRRQAG